MIPLRLYDRTRTPTSWTDIIQPGQFVAFAKTIETGAPCDPTGRPFAAVEDATCLVFGGLGDAEAFCREQVERAPDVQFEIFDSSGRAQAPLLVIVDPSKANRLEGNPRGMRLRMLAAAALFVVAALSFWYDYEHGPGIQIFPTLLGINLVVVAARLLQLNGSYAHAERMRKERLAQYEGCAPSGPPK